MCVSKGGVVKNASKRQSTIRTERCPGAECVLAQRKPSVSRSLVIGRTEGGDSG